MTQHLNIHITLTYWSYCLTNSTPSYAISQQENVGRFCSRHWVKISKKRATKNALHTFCPLPNKDQLVDRDLNNKMNGLSGLWGTCQILQANNPIQYIEPLMDFYKFYKVFVFGLVDHGLYPLAAKSIRWKVVHSSSWKILLCIKNESWKKEEQLKKMFCFCTLLFAANHSFDTYSLFCKKA